MTMTQDGSGPSKITAAVRYIAEALNNLSVSLSQFRRQVRAQTGTSYTVASDDTSLILSPSGAFTLTLPDPAGVSGKILYLVNQAAQTISSASANVVPLAGGAAGTAILAATAGKWAILQSNGTNWLIIAAN